MKPKISLAITVPIISLIAILFVFSSVVFAWITLNTNSNVDQLVIDTDSKAVDIVLYQYDDISKVGYTPMGNETFTLINNSYTFGEHVFSEFVAGQALNTRANNEKIIPGDVLSFLLEINNINGIDDYLNIVFEGIESVNAQDNVKIQNAFTCEIRQIAINDNYSIISNELISISYSGYANSNLISQSLSTDTGSKEVLSHFHYVASQGERLFIFFDLKFNGDYEYYENDVLTTSSNPFSVQTLQIGKLKVYVE